MIHIPERVDTILSVKQDHPHFHSIQFSHQCSNIFIATPKSRCPYPVLEAELFPHPKRLPNLEVVVIKVHSTGILAQAAESQNKVRLQRLMGLIAVNATLGSECRARVASLGG